MLLYFLNSYLRLKKIYTTIFFGSAFFIFGNILSIRAQSPTITSFTPTTVCQGGAVIITGANFTGATVVKLGASNAASFTVDNATTITAIADAPVTGIISITTPIGMGTSSGQITILPAPIPILTDASNPSDPFTNCNGNTTYQLTVRNGSTPAGGSCNYEINWGDNPTPFTQTDWSAGAQTTHTYNAQGYFNIVFTITPANGCKKTITYPFYNGTNPLASFTTTHPTTGLCITASVEFQIGNWYNNSAGTTYQLDFGDGSQKVILQHPLNSTNTIQLPSHQYTTSSCPNVDFTATLKAINGCFTTTYTLNQIIIRKKPIADFSSLPSPACVNAPVCFSNLTIDGYSGNSCNTTSNYTWDFGDGTTSNQKTPSCHTYLSAGTYNVTLTASNATCGSDTKTKTVVILPTSPLPVVTATAISYCQGQVAVALNASGTGLLWYTTISGGTGSSVAPTPLTNVPGSIKYYVSQTKTNECESPRVPITVTINSTPSAPIVNTPVQLCQNQTAVPLTATGTGLLWYSNSTGGTGSSTPPTPSTTAIGNTTYYVSQTTNGCEGPRASIVATVNSLTGAPVVTSPLIYCQNQTAVPLTATGTGLIWYTNAIGGTGSSITPTPSTSTVGSTTYYVSQVTGCGEGPRASIIVDVKANPSAAIAYSKTNLCNVVNTASTPNPPITVSLTGTAGGNYSISPLTGLSIDATTGTISPTGATAGNYIIKYTIPGTGGCSDFITTATVNVSSSPDATIIYPLVCSSDAATNVQLTGTQGGTFTSTSGLKIDPITGTITPATSTPGTYTVTYTILPSSPCPGFITTASITITKAPSASITYNFTNICNVVDSSSTPNPPITVSLTGTTGGNYSISPSTGLSIDATTGTITPSGATAGNYTIKYTIPGTGGCSDFTTTTTVNVSGAPTATIKYPSVCSSDAATNVQLTGTRGGIFTSSSGLTIDPLTGTITPATSTPGTYTVTYTILPSSPCPGFITTTSITVTKAPSASITYNPTNICNVVDTSSTPNPPITVSLTGTAGGNYSISPLSGLSIDATTGTITPSGATAGNYTIKYTIPGSGGCPDFNTTAAVNVSGAPTAAIKYPPVCTSDAATNVQLTGTRGGTFTSSAGLTIDPLMGTVTPATSTPGIYTVTYTILPASPCPGFITTTPITITKAPFASIAYSPSNLCNVINTGSTPNPPVTVTITGDAGGSYSIAPITGLSINTTTGTLDPSGAAAGIYTITYTIPGTGGCSDFRKTTIVTISGTPNATISYPGSPYCSGINIPQRVLSSGTPGGIYTAGPGLSVNATTGEITPALSAPGIYTVAYSIAASTPCPGYVATAGVEIVESPVLTFPTSFQSICSNGTAIFTPSSTVANTTYAWSVIGTLPSNVSGVSSGTSSGPNPVISLLFINTSTISQSINIQVIPTNAAQSRCAGTPYNLILIVNPVPAAPVPDTFNLCMGRPDTSLTAHTLPGNTIKWYDENFVLLGAAPIISTHLPFLLTYNVSQVNSYGCESPKSKILAIVHPTAKIISSSYVGSSRVDLQACKLEYSIVSPK